MFQRTSDVDWCERNHQITPYIAEFWNTLSSVPVSLFALHGLLHVSKHSLGSPHAIAHLLCFIVGIGSVIFHGTLSWQGQALDELPMLYCSSFMVWCMVRVRQGWSSSDAARAAGGLALLNAIVTFFYFRKGFLLFIGTYVSIVASMIGLSIAHVATQKEGTEAKQQQQLLLYRSVKIYVGGTLLLWVPEMIFCGNRIFQTHDSVFEHMYLHAFFHLTSAVGSYTFTVFACFADHSRFEPAVGIRNTVSALSLFMPLPHVVFLDGASSVGGGAAGGRVMLTNDNVALKLQAAGTTNSNKKRESTKRSASSSSAKSKQRASSKKKVKK